MSVSMLQQLFLKPQPFLCRRSCQALAARFNSTLAQSPETVDSTWSKAILHPDQERTSVRPSSTDPQNDKNSLEYLWRDRSTKFESTRMSLTPHDAYSGRSVRVANGDVANAAKQLDRILAQNYVARDWFINRRHKQKGEERRRLKSMRWRRRFKHEVGEKVQLVQQIRRRGA